MNGFLNLLKPPGMTSSDAVVRIRKTLTGEKVGHAGTLDPEAAGVLPIMIGKAARLFDALQEKEKAYIAEIALGIATDTQDAQGKMIEQSQNIPGMDALISVLPQFVGEIAQTPPDFSALKVAGRTAYALARKGESISLPKRHVTITKLDFIEQTGEDSALLSVACGKGTYIRTLCVDIGRALSCPAHLRFLLRTKSGAFDIDSSVTLEEWEASAQKEALLAKLDAPLAHIPLVRAEEKYYPQIQNGMELTRFAGPDVAERPGLIRIYCGDQFAGLARWKEGKLRFQAMLL